MSEEIKVGEYIRTKNGYIGYVENINDFREPSMKYAIEMQKSDLIFVGEEDIKTHSSNIIDLIEVGDYVNGERVEKIAEPSLANCQKKLIYCNECEGLYKLVLDNEDIKSIVTREQFERMEYKVNEQSR